LASCKPAPYRTAVAFGEVIHPPANGEAVTVKVGYSLAWDFKATAAQFCNKLGTVATPGGAIKVLPWHWAGVECMDGTEMARVVGGKIALVEGARFCVLGAGVFHY
jgi:hypothetical protein